MEKNKPIRKFQEQTHHKEKIEIKKSEEELKKEKEQRIVLSFK